MLFIGCNSERKQLSVSNIAQDTTKQERQVDTTQNVDVFIDDMGNDVICFTKEELEQLQHEQDSINKKTIAMICKGDSLFHIMPSCPHVDIKKCKFTNVYIARKHNLKLCEDCVSNLEVLALKYSENLYNEDDIYEYVLCNKDLFVDIFEDMFVCEHEE